MVTLHFVLLILAFVVFALSAAGVVTTRVNLIALGLALWVLAILVGAK
jgi:hypothetical protein